MLFNVSRTHKGVILLSVEADASACSSLVVAIVCFDDKSQEDTDSNGTRGIFHSKALVSHTSAAECFGCRACHQLDWSGCACGQNKSDVISCWHWNENTDSCKAQVAHGIVWALRANALEGNDDPGKIFIKKHNVRALPRAMSLLNLQGCEVLESATNWW